MALTWTTTSGGWENRDTWPNRTRKLVVTAFRDPKYGSPVSNAPTERAKLYPRDGGFNIMQRHKPQLAWTSGTYEIPGHQDGHPVICKYPNLIGPWENGKRQCLKPGALTVAEKQALNNRYNIDTSKISNENYDPCANPKTKRYHKFTDKSGYQHIYSCPAPGKFITKYRPAAVRGLGETEREKEGVAALKTKYFTSELTLAAAMLAGLYLVMKR